MAPFDDSLIVSVFAAAILSQQEKKLSQIADEVKAYPFDRVNFECDDKRKFIVVENLRRQFKKDYKNITTLDGVRIDFPDGWILIRPSNTSPFIRLTVEAEDQKVMKRLTGKFSDILRREIERK
jgi:phosphomannomutase